eukprot:TRINITY_DN2908_c0_g1_i5.p1 TRINITY_DN2908_c0_g1~~TRINITY_DN2908_c0_g1_i5.p1  ORF type:complete len:1815 (-),score=266.53 TRINITY_DN2908_c0_g1_i5:405-5849(-)
MYSGGPGDSRGSFRGGSAPGSNANIPPNFRDMNGFGSQFDRPRDWGGPYRRDTPFYRDNDRDRDFRGGGGNGAGRGGFRGKRDWTPSREYGMHPGMSFSAGMTPRGSYRDRDDPEATISPKRRRMSRTGARDDLDRDASPMSPPRGASPASILARRSRSPSPSGSGRLSPPPLSLSQNSAPAYGRSRSRSPSGRAPSPDRRGDTSPRHTYNSHTPSHFPPPKDRFTPRPSPHMYYNNNNNNRDRFRDDRGPPRTDRERYSSPSAGGSSPPRAGFTPRNGREPYRFAGTASPMYPRDSEYRPDRDSSSDRQDHRYDRDRDRDRDRDFDRGDRDRDKLRDPPLRDKERPSPSPSPSLTSRSYKDDMPPTPRRDSFTSPANPLAASTPLQLHTPVVSPRLSTSLPSVPPTALLSPTDSPLMSPSALSGSGETTQQRKRLGWGQGLMAIEKKVNPADEPSPISSPGPLRSPSPPPQASVPLSPQLARSPPFSLGSQAPTLPQSLPATPTPMPTPTPTFTTPLSPRPIAPLGDPSTLNGEPSRNPFNTVGQSPRGAAPPRPWAPPHALSVSTPTGISTMPSNIPAAFLPTTPTSSFAPSPPVTPRDPRLADPRISVSDPRLSTPLAHRQPGPPPPLSLSAQSIEPPSRMSTPPPSMPTPSLSVSAPSVLPPPAAEPVVPTPPLPSKEEVLFKIEKLDMEIAKTENEITQTQRARQQLESSPKRTRAKETESNRSDRPLHEVIYEDNKEKAAQAADDLLLLMPAPVTPTLFQSSIPVTALVVPLRPEDYTEAVENHKLIRSRVASVVRQRVIEANSHMHELADQYKAIARDWKLKCREFEDQRAAREAQRVAAARRRKSNSSAPSSPHMNGGSSTRPALRVGGPTPAIGSPPTRRGGLLGSSDVVHSEAELMEILAQLQEQEENNPDTRYCSALATIPPMVLDDYVADGEGAGEGAMGRRKFYDQNGYVEDCLALERARKQTSIWNEEDKALFVKKYLQYPKNFKRIASFFPDRNTEEMVAFYYANKKTLNLKRLLKQSQTRRGGRGPRKSITEPASTSTASHSSGSGSTNTSSSSNSHMTTPSTVSRELVGLGSASPLTSNYWGSVSAERPGRNAFRPPIIPAQQLDESEDDYIGSPPSTPGMRRTSVNSSGDDLSNSGGLGLDGLRWTDTEKDQFLVAIRAHGRDFKSIAEQVGTRTISQCKNYYHSNKKKLQLDNIIEQRERRASAMEGGEPDEVTPAESDTKGGAAQEKEKPKNKKSVPEAKRKATTSSATTIPIPSPVATSAPAITTASAAAVTIPSTPTSAPAPIPPASVDVAPVPAVPIPSAAPASVASPPVSTSADAMSDSASSPAAPKAPRVVSYWTPLEKQEFLKYLALYGKNWKVLAEHITGKTQNQIKNYFQNYKVKLNLNDLLENTKEEREANKARAAPPSAADLARKKRKKEGDAPSPTPSQLSSSTSPNAEEQTPTALVPVRMLSTQTAPQGLIWPVEMKQEAVSAASIPAAPQPTVVYSPPVVVPAAAPFVVSTLSPRNEQESMLADLLTTMSDRAAQDMPAPAPSAQLDAAPSGPSDPSLEPAPTTSEDPSSVDAAAALATLAALAPPDASIPLEVEAVVPVPAPLEADPELQTSLLEEVAQAAADDVSMEDAPILEAPVLDAVTTPPTLPPPTMQQEEQTNLPLADPADTTSVDIDISAAPSEDNILDDTAAPPLSPLPNTITSEMGEDTLSPPMPAMHDTVPPTDLSASDNLEPVTIMETDSNVSLEPPLGEALPVPAGGDDWQCADISHTDDPVETTPVLVSTEEQGSTDQPSLREGQHP